ncbi:hypothetical protein [Agromyces subbeticus]|uniref:hypothetical protein n=1 Tax=Agromyces subbeticus TaxID=293890 RepID=UPI0003B5874C|nr:hypothetical protein [Agromyces subbeticus]
MSKLLVDHHADEPALFAGDVIISYRFVCDRCGQPVDSVDDHVVFESTPEGTPASFDFRHKHCDQETSPLRFVTVGSFLASLRQYGFYTPAG